MSLLISTSIHSPARRTVISFFWISGASAAPRRSAMLSSWRCARRSCCASRRSSPRCAVPEGRRLGSGRVSAGLDLIGVGRSPPWPCSAWSPTCTGRRVVGVPPNAALIASAMTRYLASLIVDSAYITTKKASSNVIRSA